MEVKNFLWMRCRFYTPLESRFGYDLLGLSWILSLHSWFLLHGVNALILVILTKAWPRK